MTTNNVIFTTPFRKRTSQEFRDDIFKKSQMVLPLFPELKGDKFKIGLTTSLGTVARAYTRLAPDQIKIGINPINKTISYFTLGHELTHFVQHISDIPSGEKTCDIWTIARNELFLDETPSYLKIPLFIHDNWNKYANAIRELCIKSIKYRNEHPRAHYIVRLEKQIHELEVNR